MKMLVDNRDVESLIDLKKSWQSEESVAIIPKKTSVKLEELKTLFRLIPEKYQRDHFVILTSGSTGIPKIVVGNKQRAEALAWKLHDLQCSEPVESTILTLPLSYSFALVNQWVWSLVSGRNLILTAGLFEGRDFLDALKQTGATMLCLVGAQIPQLKEALKNDGPCNFPSVKRIHFAGGPFPLHSITYISSIFPNAIIYNNYGCTEAMPRLTLRVNEGKDQANNIGFALPGVELRVDNQDHLLFRSQYGAVATLEGGIFNEIQPGQWVATGDLAKKNHDGSWSIQGRDHDFFKRYGEKVSLDHVASKLKESWPREFTFLMEQDSMKEEGYALVLSPNPNDLESKKILTVFRKSFSRVHWPLRIESVENMPLLPNGKVDNKTLATLKNRRIIWRQRI
jgi:long-chain acyl-CoA synthetase